MDKVGEAADAFVKIVGVGLVLITVCFAGWQFTMSDADRFSSQYNVPASAVVVEPKPHGCEFDDAPLGEKHCHFEKDVNVVRECEQPNCKVHAVYVSWRKVSE